jgi:HK97 gp10 family phage protein
MPGGIDSWDADRVLADFRRRAGRGIRAAAVEGSNDVKAALSVPGTVPAGAAGARDRRGRSRRVYGAERSKPGEPPRKQRGTLRRSIAWLFDEATLTGRVGTGLMYGRYLELGTAHMAPRPFLRATLLKYRSKYLKIITRGSR